MANENYDVRPVIGRLLTVDEAAESLKVTPYCLRAWLLRRRIGSFRVGRRVRIPESEIQRILTEGYIPAREASQ